MVGKKKVVVKEEPKEIIEDGAAIGVEVQTETPSETPIKVQTKEPPKSVDPLTGEVVVGEEAIAILAKRAENQILYSGTIASSGEVVTVEDGILKYETNGTVTCWRMPADKYKHWNETQRQRFLKSQDITMPELKDGSPFQEDEGFVYVYENQAKRLEAQKNG